MADLVKSWSPEFIITNGDNNYQLGGETRLMRISGNIIMTTFFRIKACMARRHRKSFLASARGQFVEGFSLHQHRLHWPLFRLFHPAGQQNVTTTSSKVRCIFLQQQQYRTQMAIPAPQIQAQWLQAGLAAATEPWKIVVPNSRPILRAVSSATRSIRRAGPSKPGALRW